MAAAEDDGVDRTYLKIAPEIWVILLACRSVAQPGSASALGAEGREFESRRSDHDIKGLALKNARPFFRF